MAFTSRRQADAEIFDAKSEGGEPRNPLAPCPPEINIENPLVAAKRTADGPTVEAATIAEETTLLVHAYSDGSMHPAFRKQLALRGAEALAKKASLAGVTVSRPSSVLADPYD